MTGAGESSGIDLPEDDVRERLAYRDGKWVAGLIPLLRLVVRPGTAPRSPAWRTCPRAGR